MQLKTTSVKYNDINFVFVSSHYDIHLEGLCRYENELHFFKTDYDTEVVSIYSLSFVEKIKYILNKKKFEFCVGYNWSYPKIKRYDWKPSWLKKILFQFYYYKFFKKYPKDYFNG